MQRYRELRERLDALVRARDGRPRSRSRSLGAGSEGEAIVTKVIDQLYEDMEDLE